MCRCSALRILFACLLMILTNSACSQATQPADRPAASTELQRIPDTDIRPILISFLSGLPADWNLASTQDLVKESPFLVDVRQTEEYHRGFIAGAINIPLRDLARNLEALPEVDKEIVLVCDTGHRSAIGMAILQMLGYKKAKSLEGGMQSWQAAKQPIVTTPLPQKQIKQGSKANPQIQAMLDYYLAHTLPYDWGVIDSRGLTADQLLRPSSAGEAMPETYDQGASLLVDVDTPEEFQKSTLFNFVRAINLPLRQLPDALDSMPLQETIDWA